MGRKKKEEAESWDPLKELEAYARGDVVALGLMTEEELKAEEEFNEDGVLVKPSGKEVALGMLPVKVRTDALKEVLAYHRGKKRPSEEELDPPQEEEPIQFFIPDNGRDNIPSAG